MPRFDDYSLAELTVAAERMADHIAQLVRQADAWLRCLDECRTEIERRCDAEWEALVAQLNG